MNKLTKRFVITAILMTLVALMLGCSGSESSPQNQPNATQASSTGNSPAFSAQDLTGKLRSSDEWLGKKPVVINFWGTWCPPCRREIPDLVKLNDEYSGKGVALVSLAVNDSPSGVKEYAANNNMKWELLMAEDKILVDYKVTTGIPTTIFIDKNGNEITRFIGMRDYATLKQGFDAIL